MTLASLISDKEACRELRGSLCDEESKYFREQMDSNTQLIQYLQQEIHRLSLDELFKNEARNAGQI